MALLTRRRRPPTHRLVFCVLECSDHLMVVC